MWDTVNCGITIKIVRWNVSMFDSWTWTCLLSHEAGTIVHSRWQSRQRQTISKNCNGPKAQMVWFGYGAECDGRAGRLERIVVPNSLGNNIDIRFASWWRFGIWLVDAIITCYNHFVANYRWLWHCIYINRPALWKGFHCT